jgi:hypothetical protein
MQSSLGWCLDVIRRNQYVKAGVRATLAALPLAITVTCAGLVAADPGPVQPGVSTPGASVPDAPGNPTVDQAAQGSDQPVELHQASPQAQAPAPQYTKPRPSPTPDPTPDPAPRTVRVGGFETQVPDGVPDDVVQGIQGMLNPGGGNGGQGH